MGLWRPGLAAKKKACHAPACFTGPQSGLYSQVTHLFPFHGLIHTLYGGNSVRLTRDLRSRSIEMCAKLFFEQKGQGTEVEMECDRIYTDVCPPPHNARKDRSINNKLYESYQLSNPKQKKKETQTHENVYSSCFPLNKSTSTSPSPFKTNIKKMVVPNCNYVSVPLWVVGH